MLFIINHRYYWFHCWFCESSTCLAFQRRLPDTNWHTASSATVIFGRETFSSSCLHLPTLIGLYGASALCGWGPQSAEVWWDCEKSSHVLSSITYNSVRIHQGGVKQQGLPIVSSTETIEKGKTVLLHCHLAQLVLQTHSLDIDSLMTQKDRLCVHRNAMSKPVYWSCQNNSNMDLKNVFSANLYNPEVQKAFC